MCRWWFNDMELVKESPSAPPDMYWWPCVNETVVLSAHEQSGIPTMFQGRVAEVTGMSEDGPEYGYYCSLTDQYVRTRKRYVVEMFHPEWVRENNPDGHHTLDRLAIPLLEPTSVSWPQGDLLDELRKVACTPTSRILYTPGNVRIKDGVHKIECTSLVEVVSRCISYLPSHLRRFTESYTQLYETLLTASWDLNKLYNQAQRKIPSIKTVGVNLNRQIQKSTYQWDLIRFTGNAERQRHRGTVLCRNTTWTIQAGDLLSCSLQLLAIIDRLVETEEVQQQTLVQTAFFTCNTLVDYEKVMKSPCYDKTESKSHISSLDGTSAGTAAPERQEGGGHHAI